MTIVVCVKHVPDLQSDRRFGADGRLVRDPADSTLNELDAHAIEAALVVAEATGDQVVALTVGPPPAVAAVRSALQMGAHGGVHVTDDAVAGSDVFGTAKVLAGAIRRIDRTTDTDVRAETAEGAGDGPTGPVRMVLTGMAALDGLTAMLPTALAVELDLPALTLAAELTVADGTARVVRDLDTAREVLTAPLPAVVSVTDQSNRPRFPSFEGIMAARQASVTTWSLQDVGVDPAQVGAAAARTKVLSAEPRPPREDQVLITDAGDGGRRLAQYLLENKLV